MHTRWSRRRFLSQTAKSVGAALAVPAIARAGSLGAGDNPSASDRIRIGFIGVGGMGSGHLGGYLGNKRCPIVAIADVDEAHRQAAGKRAGPHCGLYNDYRELLDRKDVDAVVIAVPDHWHAPVAIHACEAGKDVYCEKPLSLTIRQGRKMVEAARRYARVFQTGSQQRSSGEFRQACELVRSGRIGKVERVLVGVWGTSSPCHLPAEDPPTGLDWNRWIGPAPWRPYHHEIHPFRWRAFRDYSGGMMTDWGAHHLDIAQWGLGMDGGGPIEVLPPEGDRQYVTIKYASGVPVRCGQLDANGVRFEGAEGKITVNRGYFKAEPEEIAREPLGPGDALLYRSPGHHEDWQQAMVTRHRPICDVEIGHRSVTVCHLSNLAIWLNRPIRWSPEKEEIINDEEASRWLDRPMRAPFQI
ncbi:MAG: Gfo/Idh/MocA family oxidoreductase [Planctomycetes bacterium]|nr:Gfo/Idh/MocA family oxidoreductase [Planctomycetota bacterium]